MKKSKKFRGLGASFIEGQVYSFIQNQQVTGDVFVVQKSRNGRSFQGIATNAKIVSITESSDCLDDCSAFNVSAHDGYYYMAYQVRPQKKDLGKLCVAQSRDLINWEKVGIVAAGASTGKIVPDFTFKDHLMLYAGGESLSLHASNDVTTWHKEQDNLLPGIPDKDHVIEVVDIKIIDEGIFVSYYLAPTNTALYGVNNYKLHAALFSITNPAVLLWSSTVPIHDVAEKNRDLVYPFGLVVLKEAFVSYWQGVDGGIYLFNHLFAHKKFTADEELIDDNFPVLERIEENPIMAPQKSTDWESKAAFNPAAIYENGKIHLLYRAIGDHDVSVLGYAQSSDGVTIDKRLPYPVYIPREPFEGAPTPVVPAEHKAHNTDSPYMSGGGGWGGCEDPKLTRIDDRVYLTYVAYNGWQPPRLAMSWIGIDEFLAHDWKWSKPVLLSKPGVIDKSGCILPEKINGKYVIFHRVFPDILVDFVDSLDDFDGTTTFLRGEYKIPLREGMWDSGKASFGAPPIKTKDGWLVIYHATTGRQEWHGTDLRYKIGAMLLDLDDPTKVIYRTNKALLEPETHYENDGAKYGIAYPCGAVVKEGTLYVYYGGSDEFTCVAKADLDTLLEDIKRTGSTKMEM